MNEKSELGFKVPFKQNFMWGLLIKLNTLKKMVQHK